VCSILTSAALADEQQFTASDRAPINFTRAIALTLERNPSLVASGYQIDLKAAGVLQAGLRPNPELRVSAENFTGSDRYSAVDNAETTISLAWVLERGKREKRVEAARASVSLAETERDIKRMDAAAQTARLFLDCLSFDVRLKQASQAIELAQATVATVTKRVEAGRSPAADRVRAEVDLARAKLIQEDLEHQRLVAVHRLAAQWGTRKPDFTNVLGDFARIPKVRTYEALLEQIKDNPDQRRFLSERRLREFEIQLAEHNVRPNWRVSAGIRRFESSDDHAFVAELNIPLALRNKNQGRIAAARTTLAISSAQQTDALLRIETKLFELYQELQHSLHVAKAYNSDILPKVEQALDETERAYAAGRYSFYELSAARSDLLSAKASSVDATVETLRYIIEIERLTGVSLRSSLTDVGDAS